MSWCFFQKKIPMNCLLPTDSFVLGVDYHAYCFPKNLTFLYVLHKILHKCCYIQCWVDYLQSVTDSKLRKKIVVSNVIHYLF